MTIYHKSTTGIESFYQSEETHYDHNEQELVSYCGDERVSLTEGLVKIYDGGVAIQYYDLNTTTPKDGDAVSDVLWRTEFKQKGLIRDGFEQV